MGLIPVRVLLNFSALTASYPELGVLWAQWKGWTTQLSFVHFIDEV